MRLYTLLSVVLLAISSCVTGSKSPRRTVVNYNLTIAPDFSSRINALNYPKPVSDAEIVETLVNNIDKILVKGRETGQLDRFSIGFINKQLINHYQVDPNVLDIDFSTFANQEDRIKYIKGKDQKRNFFEDRKRFVSELDRIYTVASQNTYGADIWTYLSQGIDSSAVRTDSIEFDLGNQPFVNKFRNTLILLTDGYIEAGIYEQGYDISAKRVNAFRNAFNASGQQDVKKFFSEHNEYRITPVENPLLKHLDVLVLEVYDRSESNTGATVHPTDFEIMKLFWDDWLKQSGVRNHKFLPKFTTKAEAEKAILDFIGVK